MVEVPVPTVEHVLAVLAGYLAGSISPTYYAAERLRGAGRALSSALPYRPPPGMDEEEALQKAVDDVEIGEQGDRL